MHAINSGLLLGRGHLGPKVGGPARGGGRRRLAARPAPARPRATSKTAPTPTGTHAGTLVFTTLFRAAAAGEGVDAGVGGAAATVTVDDGESSRAPPPSSGNPWS